MKQIVLTLFFLFCFVMAYSVTYSISGKIVDKKTGSPIESACIYIANTTNNTTSGKNGVFKLTSLHDGASHLVVTCVGYQTFSLKIPLNSDKVNVLVELVDKSYQLKQVKIEDKDPNREKKLKIFYNKLIGVTRNALHCKIMNPYVLRLVGKFSLDNIMPYEDVKNADNILDSINYTDSNKLRVFADSMLVIKNEALGYTIFYNLSYYCQTLNSITFYGYPFFEDWLATGKAYKGVVKNRELAYEGSKMHFFRSLFSKRLEEEGFEINKLDTFTKKSIDNKDYGLLQDLESMEKSKIVLVQTKEKLNLYDYVQFDTIPGSKILTIKEPFEIHYLKKGEEFRYSNQFCFNDGITRTKNIQTTIVKLKKGIVHFYSNGSTDIADEIITIGYWSFKQMADLLPFNYSPYLD